jgi:hypothetical protein
MKYDVLTLDTQAIEANAFKFDGGLLAQLKQFKQGPTKVILSAIVIREVFAHLIAKTTSASDKMLLLQAECVDFGLIASEGLMAARSEVDIKQVVKKRLEAFLNDIGAEIVKFDDVSISELMQRYFQPAPPFSGSGKKKNEFPDAIALISLETWAASNSKNILAVSADPDWSKYAERSERIDVVGSLADALNMLQEHEEEAEAIVQTALSKITSGDASDLDTEFEGLLKAAVSNYGSISAEADSRYQWEADLVELELGSYKFRDDGPRFSFFVVQAGPQIVVAQISADLTVEASATFSFEMYDSVDKDYTPAGSSHCSFETEIEVELLVTFTGDFEAGDIEVTKIEIVDAPRTIDFGTLDPDYGDRDYDPDESEPPDDFSFGSESSPNLPF